MFTIPLLKRGDRRLGILANLMGVGLIILLAGLWFVQIVRASHFESDLRRQSLKRIGIPAIRGRILDHNGLVLADNRPHYNAILYLEDLQSQFTDAYRQLAKLYGAEHPQAVLANGRVRLASATSAKLQLAADCQVVSNITYRVSTSLHEPRILNTNAFLKHYTNYPYVPFEIVPDMRPDQLAVFAEQLSWQADMEIETQPVRWYPDGDIGAHILGYVQRRSPADLAEEDWEGPVSYAMPGYKGTTGLERIFDSDLRGQPGLKYVLVNSQNYRQREDIVTPNEPGDDLYLTIDRGVQEAAQTNLAKVFPHVRGAAVVLDVRNGDVIAMVSAPSYDPNDLAVGMTPEETAAFNDPINKPQMNRAISGAYPPGSTFKIITSIACLEAGLNPDEEFDSPGYYQAGPNARPIKDTAVAGKYNFNRAFFRSSNTYFIHYGLMAGQRRLLEVAHRFHLGEKTDFLIGPEVKGNIPPPELAGIALPESSTADICIGQEVTTTPLQVAGMISVVANGGNLFWPRLATHLHARESGQDTVLFEPGQLRDTVKIAPRDLEIIRHAMLDDTEHPATADTLQGTAYNEFHHGTKPLLGNFRVAGKTGTAQIKNNKGRYDITWFASYGPYESPRYAVVVMVEHGGSGGGTCAPVAEKIYEALIKMEQSKTAPAQTLARN